jgi:1-aminocyclopropane-1-carboxylate deaminase/D-cysteine desulfhydrase-like pyridoxal-dependent ACC family enzyme
VAASIPIGGSTAVGSVGYIVAFDEIMTQCRDAGFVPRTIVFTSSSGGTHAGLVAGRAAWIVTHPGEQVPDIVAIGVAKGVVAGFPSVADLAREALSVAGRTGTVDDDAVVVDGRWLGPDYAIATAESRAAREWAAHNGAWVVDDVYTAKGMAGLLGNIEQGRWGRDDDIVFVHTGGQPEVFVRHES